MIPRVILPLPASTTGAGSPAQATFAAPEASPGTGGPGHLRRGMSHRIDAALDTKTHGIPVLRPSDPRPPGAHPVRRMAFETRFGDS